MGFSGFCCKVLLGAALTSSMLCAAQNRPKRDSLYDKIEVFSKKRKVSKFLYGLIFRNVPDASVVPATPAVPKVDHSGKHIRNIVITSFDPLGYSKDLQQKNMNWYENFGNRLHVKSKNFAVRGYMLFKKGDLYNEQTIYESERILRDTRFISRVSIKPIDETSDQDSVDIAVKVLDSWSLRPLGSISSRRLGVGLAEDNFLGMGHEASLYYRTDFKTKQTYKLASYTANNVFGTYINAKIRAEKDFDKNENVYGHIQRDFVSPLTKWAGGISINYYRRNLFYPTELKGDFETFPKVAVKAHNQELWGGYQVALKKSGTDKITDNLAFTLGVQNFVYVETIPLEYDPGRLFQSYNLYLGSIGFTQRKFEVKKNIFNYEMPEDVPYGKLLTITAGAMNQRNSPVMPYLGIAAGYGDFTKFGYFNYKAQYGTFLRHDQAYQSVFRIDGTYFSPLRQNNKIDLRHFLSQTLVMGSGRNATHTDRLNISDRTEFSEYNINFMGKDKLILRYQLQTFINKSWKNFQINPYFTMAAGWLSTDTVPLFKTTTYTKFGLGVHFYNPYLAFNRFQFSVVYYPKVPFDNPGVEFNEYRNYYMPINTFRMEQPHVVNYSTWR